MKRGATLLGVDALIAVTVWAFSPTRAGDGAAPGRRVGSTDAYNPVTAGERLPDGFRQLLPRDGIAPVYEPSFVDAAGVDWPPGAQVIGIVADDEAKAYPVSFLNRREMVIDEIGGDPVLVTW